MAWPDIDPTDTGDWLGYGADIQLNGGALGRVVDGMAYLDYVNPGATAGTPGITVEQCAVLCGNLVARGVAVQCPTFITADPDGVWYPNLGVCADFLETELGKRHCPGIHLEAFFRPTPGYRGAHPENCCVQRVTAEDFHRVQEAAHGRIVLLTCGADVEGIEEVIRAAVSQQVRVAIGHFGVLPKLVDGVSTFPPDEIRALKEAVRRCIDAGASLVTHVGNGQHPLLHRHLAHLGVELADPRLGVSMIPDGDNGHLPEEFVRIVLMSKGIEATIIVSDAAPLAGMPARDEPYDIWNSKVDIVANADGSCTIYGHGQRELLAGAWKMLPETMSSMAQWAKRWNWELRPGLPITVRDITKMAWDNPLRFLGLDALKYVHRENPRMEVTSELEFVVPN